MFNAPQPQIHHRTTIIPTIQRNNTVVQLNRQADRNQNNQPIVHPTINKEETRTQVVQAPAKQIITQPVVQHLVHHQETHHHHRPTIKKKVNVRKVAVPTPIIQKIPVYRKVQAVVDTKVLPAQTFVLKRRGGFSTALGAGSTLLSAGGAAGALALDGAAALNLAGAGAVALDGAAMNLADAGAVAFDGAAMNLADAGAYVEGDDDLDYTESEEEIDGGMMFQGGLVEAADYDEDLDADQIMNANQSLLSQTQANLVNQTFEAAPQIFDNSSMIIGTSN